MIRDLSFENSEARGLLSSVRYRISNRNRLAKKAAPSFGKSMDDLELEMEILKSNTNEKLLQLNDMLSRMALKIKCANKLLEISQLESNWNENGAEKFSEELIERCFSILDGLYFEPEIFPVADGSIQFEYKKSDGSYLEFDVFEDEISEYRVYPDGKDVEQTVNIDKMLEEVDNFYEEPGK